MSESSLHESAQLQKLTKKRVCCLTETQHLHVGGTFGLGGVKQQLGCVNHLRTPGKYPQMSHNIPKDPKVSRMGDTSSFFWYVEVIAPKVNEGSES